MTEALAVQKVRKSSRRGVGPLRAVIAFLPLIILLAVAILAP